MRRQVKHAWKKVSIFSPHFLACRPTDSVVITPPRFELPRSLHGKPDASMKDGDPAFARVLEHMNDDHAASIADYAQYYGNLDDYAEDATMTRISLSEMTIGYGGSSDRRTVTVPLDPPLDGSFQFRKRLVSMARTAVVGRVPRPKFPAPFVPVTLLVLHVTLLMSTFMSEEARAMLPGPVGAFIRANEAWYPWRTRSGVLKAIVATEFAHAAEGAFVALQIGKAAGVSGILRGRSLYWIIQTTLLGFPSLFLFLEGLQRLHKRRRRDD